MSERKSFRLEWPAPESREPNSEKQPSQLLNLLFGCGCLLTLLVTIPILLGVLLVL